MCAGFAASKSAVVSSVSSADVHSGAACARTQGGKQGMDAEDRAVAVRSLLVSTARESPEAALAKALEDIDRHRRALRR